MNESESLQYGKPKKNDPRKTPAPKKDQKKGSKKNPKKSAEKPNTKITFSKKVTDQLKKMVSDHNAKGKGPKASLGMLKAVYRRGAGAFSTSHAPKMSRHGWAIARVNAFLYLMRNGRPSNPNYKQDNDLLPKSHKRSSKAEKMPIPKKREGEQESDFMSRCMSDSKMREEYDYKQRLAVCMQGSQAHDAGPMNEYVFDSKDEAMKMAEKIGLKDVHEHKTGDGKTVYMPGKNMQEFQSWYDKHGAEAPYHYKKKVDEDESNASVFIYEDPQSGELYHYSRRGTYRKNGKVLVFVKKARSEYIDVGEKSEAAEYQGRKVQLNKPFRTSKGPKKFSVYVKNEKGNVVKVNFGDPNMEIKRDDPARRKSFRARHKCDNPGPKYKARYWSCKMWESKKSVTDYTG